nr:hypothetical protein CFP56_60272 [Quercus suber]
MNWTGPRLLGKSKSWISQHSISLSHNDEPTCLFILLSRDHPDGLENAKLAIEERKKEATTSRKQSDRVSWVKNALDCAVASGSLDVYQKTLAWARRFNKDQNTAREIYSNASIHTREALDLLCGFPEDCDISNITVEDVRSNVLLANQICRELFKSACMALKEPSFHQRHWEPVMALLEKVTRLRLARVDQLQDSLGLSDTEVFDSVWKDTLDTCLALERVGLEEEQNQLGFGCAGGPLQRGYEKSDDLSQPRSAALKFIDDLARQRNDLWVAYRARNDPSTLTLPTPYARGLPVQHMLPLQLSNWREGFDLPYLKQRAEAVVFMEPQMALSLQPKDKDMRMTIGALIEDYRLALKLYVLSYPIREQQALAAWKHATGPLSVSRMSTAEAFLFWRGVFIVTLGDEITGPWSYPYLDKLPFPELPLPDDVSAEEPVEWNPDPEATAYNIESRNLEPTVLDEMLYYVYDPDDRITSHPCKIIVQVNGSAAEPLWERIPIPKTTTKTQEALIAAALLHMNGKRCSSHRLLMRPFPSGKALRFPALFLDDEFLDRKNLEDTGSLITCLQALNEANPPTLLLQLVQAMFAELEANEENAKLAHDAFALLKLLSKGDRPELALDLIPEVILNRPNDSAWHRSLFTSALFDTLPAQRAKEFALSMSHSIQMRLHGRTARVPDAGTTAKVPRLPPVKITSVKMLAQLAIGAEFIDEATSVRILKDLMLNASHLDIRVAVVQSLIHIFADSQDRTAKDNILDVLEEYAVPIAGRLNEQIETTESDWEKAESDLEHLPEVYLDTTDGNLGPILTALVGAVALRKMAIEDRNDIISRLLVPSLELSAQINQRWMAVYLKHLEVPAFDLPKVPVKLRFLCAMFDHPSHLPDWAPKSWLEVFAIDRDPSPAIARVNTRIIEDVALRGSNAGRHWLAWWEPRKPDVSIHKALLTKLLVREWQTTGIGGITYAQIQDLVVRQADILIKTDNEKFGDWGQFISQLRLPFGISQTEPIWRNHCKPVVERLIRHIDNLRTPAWHKDPFRFPAYLPDPFVMQTWLLTWPHLSWSTHDPDLATLTTEISDLIDHIAAPSSSSTTSLFLHQYNILESAIVHQNGLPHADRLHLALTFGDLAYLRSSRPLRLADLLRNRLATTILCAGNDHVFPARTRILAMLRTWLACEVEEIRMRGYAVVSALKAALGGGGNEWVVV